MPTICINGNKDTSSLQSGALKLLSGRRWAGAHFGRPRWSVHGSGRVCPDSSGSQSKCTLTVILEPQQAVPQGTNLLWKGQVYRLAPEASFFQRNANGVRGIFTAAWRVWATALHPDPREKGLVPHSSGWWDVRQIPTSCLQSNLTVFRRIILPAVLTLLFCIYVRFIQYTCSVYFLFRVLFLATNNRSQQIYSSFSKKNVYSY